MAARTFTTAGVNNLWSNPANWDGGATIPQEDDSVTIPAGQTCEYDYNSAYTTGINGLTITGTLKLTRTAGTYKLFMKAATTINGAGTFDCGTALDIIPFAAKHTITGGNAWYIQGSGGLTMTVYAAEPTNKTIRLSGAEAVGQTELGVDTDVTAEASYWKAGDIIQISDFNTNDSETRTIAAAGIDAAHIDVTAGLTNAKIAGGLVQLLTRNVRFVGVAGNLCKSFTDGKLTIAGGEWTSPSNSIFSSGTGITISEGAFHTSTYVLNSTVTATISGGIFTNLSYFASSASGVSVSGGVICGAIGAFYNTTGMSISGGTFSGNTYGVSSCAGTISGGTISGNDTGMYQSSFDIRNATFVSNTNYDIRICKFTAYNVSFGQAAENVNYTSLAKEIYSESFDHDASAGAYKAWTRGGVTTKQTVIKPTGYSNSMNTVLENAIIEGYWQKEVSVGAGASVNIEMNLRKDAAMTYLPRIIVFNKASTDPFAGGAGLYTFTMTNSVDAWEDDLYTYTNSGTEDVTLVIRCQGMNATGNMYSALLVEQINVDLTNAIAKIDVIDGLVDAIKAKTDQLAFTVANQVDANALTGGGGASAEDVADAVWDEAIAGHTTVTTFGGKNQKVVPSESVNDYKADVSAITGAALSPAGVDAILDDVVVGSYTMRQILKLMAAKMHGKATGGGTTSIKYTGLDDVADVIVETVDTNGNRSAVSLTV